MKKTAVKAKNLATPGLVNPGVLWSVLQLALRNSIFFALKNSYDILLWFSKLIQICIPPEE